MYDSYIKLDSKFITSIGNYMNPSDIKSSSDSKSISRANKQPIAAKLYKVDGNKILYTVNSSEQNKQYIVTIMLLDLKGNKLKSLQSALNGNIKISCTCPGFLFRGWKYISFKKNVGIDRETRSPDKTNPNQEGLACKHILVALNQMKSDYSKIYDMFKKSEPKQAPSSDELKDNRNSTSTTETDLDVIDKFKSACDKLYKDYVNFKKNNKDDSESFEDSKFYDGNDPSTILQSLSKPVLKSLNGKFIGKLKSLSDILSLVDQKKNGFNVLLDSDIQSLIKKINGTINSKTEAFINNIILTLIGS